MNYSPRLFKIGAFVTQAAAFLYTFLVAATFIAALQHPEEVPLTAMWQYAVYIGAAIGLWFLGMMLEVMAMVVARARFRAARVQTNALAQDKPAVH